VRWIDNHCHLEPGAAAAEAVADARAHDVHRLVVVGTTPADSAAAVETAAAHEGVFATAGVHPHEAKDGGLDEIEALLSREEVVAVGECGLDHHYDNSPPQVQREVFAAQVALAHQHDLTLVIHTREAWDETFDVLSAEGVPPRTVFHCFTGGPTEARRGLDLGAHLSFSGIVTFPSAAELREAAALCPLDRLVVETDSPFLTPVPHRGTPNRPAHVALVGAAVAVAKGLGVEAVADATWRTAEALYRLPPSA
jgi:TatD DNase family protein